MDNKSKIFFAVFFLLVVGSIAATYYKIFVLQDYMIEAEAPCDPYTETCFVYICDPIEEECTGDPEEDTSYYKNISRNAKYIPLCDPADEECDALTCPSDEENCSVTLCTPNVLTDGVVCNNPTAYTLLHPIQEEEVDNLDALENEDNDESDDVASSDGLEDDEDSTEE